VFIRIRGKLHYLWRAVDQHGNVQDVLVQSRRNTKAAKRFFRKLLKGLCYVPRVIVTDKLGSYGAAKREILPGVEHRQSRYLSNCCEVSHKPTRRRERHMRRFKSAGMPDGLIRIVHFVPEHKVVVEEENGDTAAALMREAGIDATGETIILPGEDIWLTIDPPDFPDADQD
jgi:transposase-like protein